MTRVSTLAQSDLIVSQLLETQADIFDLQTQVSTEEVSQDFAGIAVDSQRLLTIENSRDTLEQFNSNNEIIGLRLDIAQTAIDGVEDTLDTFQGFLFGFQSGDVQDEVSVQSIQQQAFDALLNIQALLNTEADGRFLFGGSATQTEPVNFGLSTLDDLQETFDGARVTVPTTRDGVLNNFEFSADPFTDEPNFLAFEQDNGSGVSRVSANNAQFVNVVPGQTVTFTDTLGGLNDGTFTVESVDPNGFFIDVVTEQLTDEAITDAPVTTTFGFPNPEEPGVFLNFDADVTFDRQTSTITAATAGALSDIQEGSVFTIEGTAFNNGTFTVASNDGTSLVIEEQRFFDQGGPEETIFSAATPASVASGAPIVFDTTDGIPTVTIPAPGFVDGSGDPLPAGTEITISGTGTANDGQTFTIGSLSANSEVATLLTTPALTAGASTGDVDAPQTLTFVQNAGAADQLLAPAGTFAELSVGQSITIEGTGTNNDGRTLTIAAISEDGSTLTFDDGTSLTDAVVGTGALTSGSISLANEFFRFDASDPALTVNAGGGTTFDFGDTDPDTITLGGGATFTDANGDPLPAGTQITLSGGTGNDGTFTIASINSPANTTATLIAADSLTGAAGVATGTLTATPGLTFTDNPVGLSDTISGAPGTFLGADGQPLAAGTVITIANAASAGNNGSFTIAATSADGSTVTLEPGLDGDTLSNDPTTIFTETAPGDITFTDGNPDTISGPAGAFTDLNGDPLPAGTQITISGTGTPNDGQTFTITSVDGTNSTATLAFTDAVDTSAVTGGGGSIGAVLPEVTTISPATTITVNGFTGTVSSPTFFNGNEVSLTQRVSEDQSFEFDITAVDPAFEQGIRALFLIAQGEFGAEGGLDQNSERIGQALALLDGALERTTASPPPFGPELDGSIEEIGVELGFQQVLINDITQKNNELISFFEGAIADIEIADPLEAITSLLDQNTVLDASFQAFSLIGNLTLLDFI